MKSVHKQSNPEITGNFQKWQGYELIDSTKGERLERWGDYTLIRPDPQIIWENPNPSELWNTADAIYVRNSNGGGKWHYKKAFPECMNIKYGELTFKVKPTGFKHMGVFPEQCVNWDICGTLIRKAGRCVNVLNLFAYTGGATLACANAEANVCHLDAIKGMTDWAKENAVLSGLEKKHIRYITDDAMKFTSREIRRNNKYDGIILDPPAYGRGTNGEMWRFDDNIYALMQNCTALLSENPLFIILNSYSAGVQPSAVEYLLEMTVGKRFNHAVINAFEIGIPVTRTGLCIPCGNTCRCTFQGNDER